MAFPSKSQQLLLMFSKPHTIKKKFLRFFFVLQRINHVINIEQVCSRFERIISQKFSIKIQPATTFFSINSKAVNHAVFLAAMLCVRNTLAQNTLNMRNFLFQLGFLPIHYNNLTEIVADVVDPRRSDVVELCRVLCKVAA